MVGPLERWCDETCGICPGQVLGPGEFDVVTRPRTELTYNPELGWRATPGGTPVCVHPFRVGMPPGEYASAGTPLPRLDAEAAPLSPPPEAFVMPDALDDLGAWMVAHLRVAGQDEMFSVVTRLERQAGERFASGEVVVVLRRVLSVELARS
ncbi:hypothetical protein KOI35_28310 [Actinoplanes bogorensis]|uniref:Uncharacterized protein n=1 Tax=Paractinoplanes bogorensis TaxID=1610840 RepID=A0ABS5YVE8_9ACTN|nr:hypothetical protein [Actinoplanes bogorensis]MBU2667422.1 hypothetical protein [Actinoplanes bogorensis]